MEDLAKRSLEYRKARVLLALHILIGDRIPPIDEEEGALLGEYRGLREYGYGRMEVVVVAHQMEAINSTRHKKRADLMISGRST